MDITYEKYLNILNRLKHLESLVTMKTIDRGYIDWEIEKIKRNKKYFNKNDNSDIIISLTTIPDRIHEVHYVIYSLLMQDAIPNKIVLWLSLSQFPNREKDIPDNLLFLTSIGNIFEIKFTEHKNIPANKLLLSLNEFKNYNIITVDDDIYYPKSWLSSLINIHNKNPKAICGTKGRIIPKDIYNAKSVNDINYVDWKRIEKNIEIPTDSTNIFLVGFGGILYPKDSFTDEIYNVDESYTNDDMWFWKMAIINKIKYCVIPECMPKVYYINLDREQQRLQSRTLWTINKNNNNKMIYDIVLGGIENEC